MYYTKTTAFHSYIYIFVANHHKIFGFGYFNVILQ